jgi:hypothetical protein
MFIWWNSFRCKIYQKNKFNNRIYSRKTILPNKVFKYSVALSGVFAIDESPNIES